MQPWSMIFHFENDNKHISVMTCEEEQVTMLVMSSLFLNH